MRHLLFTLLLLSPLAFADATDEARDLLLRHRNVSGLIARIDAFSATFVGLPYGDGGPLGEGPTGSYDQDPLFRFDTFDCTTYVETVLSLARARDVADFAVRIDEIRYEHGVVQVARALIDKPNYYAFMKADALRTPGLTPAQREQRATEWRAEGARFTAVEATMDYVPIDWILANPTWVQRLRSGMVVNFVRPNWDLRALIGTHMNVSHQGLIIRRGTEILLRHASSSGNRRVTEIPLLDYLQPFRGHATLKGLHFLTTLE